MPNLCINESLQLQIYVGIILIIYYNDNYEGYGLLDLATYLSTVK